jgi:hypothetical protein
MMLRQQKNGIITSPNLMIDFICNLKPSALKGHSISGLLRIFYSEEKW